MAGAKKSTNTSFVSTSRRKRNRMKNSATPAEEEKSEASPSLRPFGPVKDDWLVAGWSLALKALLLLFGLSVVRAIENRPVGPGLLEMWKRWDVLQYFDIAEHGYTPGAHLVVHPLYPWLIRIGTWVTGNAHVSGLLLSTTALVIAVICFRRLVCLDYGPTIALRAVWFLLIFPTAYFLHAAYAESLFLALILGALLAARRLRWWQAGLLGGLAAITRATGIGILLVLACEAFLQWRESRKWKWEWLWLLAIPLCYAVYLSINLHVAGNALAFVEARRQFFRASPDWPWVGIIHLVRDFQRSPNQSEIVSIQELFFVGLSLVGTAISWVRLRPSYALWMTFNWAAFACQTFILSAPRYVIALFPLFILFAIWGQNRFWNALITAWSLLYLGLFVTLFVRGWWAF